jgi:hypothetical protein
MARLMEDRTNVGRFDYAAGVHHQDAIAQA